MNGYNILLLDNVNLSSSKNLLSSLQFRKSFNNDQLLIDFNNKTYINSNNEPIELIQDSKNKSEFIYKLSFAFDNIILNLEDNTSNLSCTLASAKNKESFDINGNALSITLNNKFVGETCLIISPRGEDSTCSSGILANFKFYREPLKVVTTSSVKSPSLVIEASPVQFPTPIVSVKRKNPFPIAMNDGPVFRDTLHEYETMIPKLLTHIRHSIEKFSHFEQYYKQLEASKSSLFKNLKEFSNNFLPPDYKTDYIFNNTNGVNCNNKSNKEDHFINLIRDLNSKYQKVNFDYFTSLSANKKNFEEESKKYYDWLSKLLSSGKSKDEKLLIKIKNFEISKINYFNYLYDGVMGILNLFLEPNSDLLTSFTKYKMKRDQFIKTIQNCQNFETFFNLAKLLSLDSANKVPSKSGLLFTQGGQGKSGWHKQWAVIKNGHLYEYMDWRKGESLRNEPIDISLCNIKQLDSVDKRKNCFRVINSSGVEHIFQAFTIEDSNSWVQSLFDAGQQIKFHKSVDKNNNINSKNIEVNPTSNRKYDRDKSEAGNFKNNLPNENDRNADGTNLLKKEEVSRQHRVSSVSLDHLRLVQNVDPSNFSCVECGSIEQVEWISINLLIVFCINCSSCHRSLGTTISKVRSLKLDNFNTKELLSLLDNINNSVSNSFYESKLPPSKKINSNSTDEERLCFIRDKYLKHLYVDDNLKRNASSLLIHGAKASSIKEILESVAGGVDVNMRLSRNFNGHNLELGVLEYALGHSKVKDNKEVFDVAELLVLNGCNVGDRIYEEGTDGLSAEAKKWWNERIVKVNGPSFRSGIDSASTTSPNSTALISNSLLKRSSPVDVNSKPPMTMTQGSLRRSVSTGSKFKSSGIKSPKEGFNLLKKRMKN